MEQWLVWLILIILLTILEVGTINLVSVWFIASAFVSLILSFFIHSFAIEFAVFVVLGLILMLLTRPILIRKFGKSNPKTNLDRVIGLEGIVTEEIPKNGVGEVKVDGKCWSAVSSKKIPVDSIVIIDSIDGVKLHVSVRKED